MVSSLTLTDVFAIIWDHFGEIPEDNFENCKFMCKKTVAPKIIIIADSLKIKQFNSDKKIMMSFINANKNLVYHDLQNDANK